jgi:predicted lipoprotein
MMLRTVLCLSLALFSTGALADVAGTLQAMYRDAMVQRATALATNGDQLAASLEAYCAGSAGDAGLAGPRSIWHKAVIRWERLSAVAIGPVLEHRVARRIDFHPTRPRLILKAIQSAPASARDMELIGTPAKGFPALEWLLWIQPVQPATPACAYAMRVAKEIGVEAHMLEQAYKLTASRNLKDQAAQVALGELVNQWVGGLERLRWTHMEMPVRVAGTAGPDAVPVYPRGASGVVATTWAAQWDLLHTLAVGGGAGSLAALLRDLGQDQVAENLAGAVARADAGMAGLDPADKTRILATARDLAALKGLVENEVATALGVSIGFSDSDGD